MVWKGDVQICNLPFLKSKDSLAEINKKLGESDCLEPY